MSNNNAAAHPKRSLWSSRIAFILVSAGAAIGLGNIWRFPYMAGENGGGVFVLTYLVFLVCIGVPAMIAEILIGRRGRGNPVDSLSRLAIESDRSSKWSTVGWLGALTLIMVLSFYSVISGIAIAYCSYALQGTFVSTDAQSIVNLWDQLMQRPSQLILWHTLFMVMTMGVVAFGVNRGIEKTTKWMMPSLFIVLILLVLYAFWIGDFKQALAFLFSFKLQDFNFHSAVQALGQALFTLATGAGAVLIYGSYLSKKTNIFNTVVIISALDLLVALLSGLAIFPIVFANDLSPNGGPGLMFQVLPLAFHEMPGAYIVSILFFILLIFAAWSSSLSMAEPLVSLLCEKKQYSRIKSSSIIGITAWGLGLVSALSFSIWQDVHILDWAVRDILIDIPTNILLPIGALLFCVFVGWIMKEPFVSEELDSPSKIMFKGWRFAIKYLCPIGITIILFTPFFVK